ncbi:hypothetical protein V6N13_088359 [Hibiscus sabdariffa]
MIGSSAQQYNFTTNTPSTVNVTPTPTNGLLPPNESGGKKTASVTSKERREQQQLQQLALGCAGAPISGSSKKYQLVGLGLTIVIWPTPYPCIGQLSG